jgi:hypothetical protein
MDRIERIGPRSPQWLQPALDPDREDIAQRRRREEERRRREKREEEQGGAPPEDGEPPHHVDVRA